MGTVKGSLGQGKKGRGPRWQQEGTRSRGRQFRKATKQRTFPIIFGPRAMRFRPCRLIEIETFVASAPLTALPSGDSQTGGGVMMSQYLMPACLPCAIIPSTLSLNLSGGVYASL